MLLLDWGHLFDVCGATCTFFFGIMRVRRKCGRQDSSGRVLRQPLTPAPQCFSISFLNTPERGRLRWISEKSSFLPPKLTWEARRQIRLTPSRICALRWVPCSELRTLGVAPKHGPSAAVWPPSADKRSIVVRSSPPRPTGQGAPG